MSEETLRIGIIGAGGNTRLHHIPKLKAQPGVELVTVANRSIASGQRVADEEGIPNVAAHWQDVVEDDSLDAVCIGTWPYLHAPITIAALEAGKHVLCEKPIGLNAAQAEQIIEAARKNDVFLMEAFMYRCSPQTAKIVELIKAGAVGRVGGGRAGRRVRDRRSAVTEIIYRWRRPWLGGSSGVG